NDKEALSYFTELLEEQDAADEVRILKTKALIMSMKSWSTESQKKFAESVDKGSKWIDKIRPNEAKDTDWLELRLLYARALKAHSDQIKAMNAQLANQELGEARKQVTIVTKIPGEFQKEARQLLTELGGASTGPVAGFQPKTFQEAYEAGKETLDGMKSATLVVQTVPARIPVEKDPAIKADLQKQLDEAKKAVADAPTEALRLFRAALALTNDETDMGQVNLVQYYLCYLSYLNNNFYDAALIGDFVAKRYPESPGARQCAKIAMAAYVRLFADEQKALREKGVTDEQLAAGTAFEASHVVEICEYITKKWADQPEAEEALNTLIPFMIQNKQLAQAEAYLQKIPVDSKSRGTAELKTGQAMWAEYLRGNMQLREWEADGVPTGVNVATRKQELSDLKGRAEKTLADGVKRMKAGGTPNPIFTAAMLSLAQIYVDTNQSAKALVELEDPKVGPLELVKRNDPAVARPGFAEETLRVALRAYIGGLETAKGAEVDKLLADANGVLDKLKEVVGDDAAGQEKLVRNYLVIARDLKAQIELADSPASKSALSKGFEQFLTKVGATASDFQVLNWVAETFYGMGEAFDNNKGGGLSPEAKKYYTQAQSAFDNILAKAGKQKGFVSDTMLIQLRMRSASCRRKLGDYPNAIKEFEGILKEKNQMVNVQVEAARTYQDWAASSKDGKYYYNAIMGGETKMPGKNEPIIWGWGGMGKRTASAPAFRDTFLESRLNLARSRYLMAKLQPKAKQIDMMQSAKRDVKNTSIVVKDYGGEVWRNRYDSLVKEIQKDLGEKQVGLLEFAQEVKPAVNK
ncbi:MAG TPA: hypothetical protein VL096_05035, partial [Pirellulaceae bacterium]|nr:hypothetical protein [Pirellulaceae bacterium]